MNTRQLNLLNIGLMIVSTIVAFIIPFELFLFSYAVLGPLHYLTEIGWLHKRNYFTKSKYDFVWLVVLGVAGTLSYFDNKFLPDFGNHWPFVAFLSALAFILIKENYLKIIAIIMIIISANFFGDAYFYLIFFAVFLPTIIHVFFFTGTFIFVGALKSKV